MDKNNFSLAKGDAMNYPNKSIVLENEIVESKAVRFANRGMDFEKAINAANTFYDDNKIAIITKRPTPIHIVKVDYKDNCRIKDAYFEKQSTADYNGVYKGRYIDFECKETKSKTSLSFHNIAIHQIKHLQKVIFHGGIAFFLIYFITLDEIYLLDAKIIIDRYLADERKSITLEDIRQNGYLIEQGYMPRIKYLDVVDKAYFNEKNI